MQLQTKHQLTISQKARFYRVFQVFFIVAITTIILLTAAAWMKSIQVQAQEPPNVITYQGRLLESGNTVTTTKAMAFVLYDALAGGNELYTASGTLASTGTLNILPTNGVFSVDLGAGDTNSLDPEIFANNSAIYLQVYIDGTPLTPRKLIASAPSAINSRYLLGYTAATNSTSQHIAVSDQYGNFTFTGTPTSTSVSGGVLYVNPESAGPNQTLFGVAVNGSERFLIDEDGDVSIAGGVTVTGTSQFNGGAIINQPINPTPYTNAEFNTVATTQYAQANNLLFSVSFNHNVVEVFDISDKDNVSLLDSVTVASPEFLTVINNYIYAISRSADSLYIIDASNPTSLDVVATHTFAEGPLSLPFDARVPIAVGNYLYIIGFTDIDIYDVSSPENPVYLKTINESISAELQLNSPVVAKVYDEKLFIADGINGVNILDVRDPLYPVPLANIDENDSVNFDAVTDLDVRDNYLYLASSVNDAIAIFDISSSTNPQVVSTFSDGVGGVSLDDPRTLRVIGNYLYVASLDDQKIQIFDITDPTNASAVGQISDGGGATVYETKFLGWVDDALLLAGVYDIQFFDLESPNISTANIGSASVEDLTIKGRSTVSGDLIVRGGVTVGRGGINVVGNAGFTVATTSLTATNTLAFSHTAYFVSAASTTDDAYVFDTRYTISNGNLLSIRNNGTARFVVDAQGNIGINSSSPQYALSVSGTAGITGNTDIGGNLTVDGQSNFAGTTTFTGDVSFGSALTLDNDNNRVGIGTSSPQYNLAVSGSLYVSGTTTFAQGIDLGSAIAIDNNNNRVGIGTSSPQYNLAVSGTTYISGNLTVKGNTANPQFVASTTIDDGGNNNANQYVGIAKYGSYLYLPQNGNLHIMDVSDPTDMSVISTDLAWQNSGSAFIAGNHLYELYQDFGMYSLSNPTEPEQVHQSFNKTAVLQGQAALHGDNLFTAGVPPGFFGLSSALTVNNVKNVLPNFSTIAIGDSVSSFAIDGQLLAIGNNQSLDFSGNYTDGAFVLYNIADPFDAQLLGSVTSTDEGTAMVEVQGVAYNNGYGYAVDVNQQTFIVIDARDPQNPVAVASIESGEQGLSLTQDEYVMGLYQQGYYYLATADALYTIDVSIPTNPKVTSQSTYETSIVFNDPLINGFLADDKYLYVYLSNDGAATPEEIHVFDIQSSNLGNASLNRTRVSYLDVLGDTNISNNLSIRGGIQANNATIGNELHFVNTLTSTENILNFSHTGLFTSYGQNVSSSFIFRGNAIGEIFRVARANDSLSDYFTVRSNGNVGINTSTPLHTLSVDGDFFVSATATFAGPIDLGALSIDNDTNKVGINSSSPQYDLAVSGTARITGDTFFDGVQTVSGNAIDPVITGVLSSADMSSVRGLAVVGNYAYMASFDNDTFIIADIRDKDTPVVLATTTLSGGLLDGINNVVVQNNYAYVTAFTAGTFVVFDVQNPHNPQYVSHLSHGDDGVYLSNAGDLQIQGNYAYVLSENNDRLQVIDISDPTNLQVLDEIVSNGAVVEMNGPHGIAVKGDVAYIVSDQDQSLQLISISDPNNLSPLGNLTNADDVAFDFPEAITIQDNLVYIAQTNGDSLSIIDVSDPNNPTTTATVADNGGTISLNGARTLEASGQYLYVGGLDSLQILQIDDTDDITPVAQLSLAPRDIALQGNYAYVTHGDTLQIIDVTGSRISNASIGSADVSRLQVRGASTIDSNLSIQGGLRVGGGALFAGDVSFTSPQGTDAVQNRLRFDRTVLFQSSVTSSASVGFVFDVANAFPTINSSTYLLSVRNNGSSAFSVSANGDIAASGTVFAANATIGTPGQPGDLAERVDIAPNDVVSPGDVMVVDPSDKDRYRRSTSPYATDVAGVISTKPSIVVGNGRTDYTAVMALVGRVPVNVSLENGSIQHGDLLVTASTTGHAMKYDSTKDDQGNIVSVVGVALDSFEGPSSTGKIMALIRTGWVNNRSQTIAELQQSLVTQAETTGAGVSEPRQLQVQNQQGQLVMTDDLDASGYYIRNLAGIVGLDNKWKIDEDGQFVVTVATQEGDASLYALQSKQTEYVFSGEGQLQDGEATITFDRLTQELIDPDEPMKVSVTLTDSANGIYVSDKTISGFTVRELANGSSNATFDWVVIATRKSPDMQDEEQTDPDIDPDDVIDTDSATSTDADPSTTTIDVSTTTIDIVTSSPDTVSSSTPDQQETPQPEDSEPTDEDVPSDSDSSIEEEEPVVIDEQEPEVSDTPVDSSDQSPPPAEEEVPLEE